MTEHINLDEIEQRICIALDDALNTARMLSQTFPTTTDWYAAKGRARTAEDRVLLLAVDLVERLRQAQREPEFSLAVWGPEQDLRSLLAVIHRDGGHHTEAAGIAQSALDAIDLINRERASDTLRAAAFEVLRTHGTGGPGFRSAIDGLKA